MATETKPGLSPPALMVRYFRIVWAFSGSRAMLLLFLMVLTALAEAIGITLFLPFLSEAKITPAANDRLSAFFVWLFSLWGGAPSAAGVLVMILVVFFIKGGLTFAQMVYQAYVNSKLFESIRTRMLSAYAAMDYRHYLRRHSGYFANATTVEVNRAVTFFSVYLTVLSYLINVILFLGVSLMVNFEFTVLAIVFGSVVLASFKFLADRTRQYSMDLSTWNARFNSLLIETIQSFKYLAATASFDRLREKLFSIISGLVGIERRLQSVSSIVHAFSEPITVSGMVVLIYYEVVVSGRSMSSILVAVMLFYRSMTAITGFQKNWQTLSAAAGGIETVINCSEELEAEREVSGTTVAPPLTTGIEFRGVSFGYGDGLVLRNVDLWIPRNSLVAFVGDSGAGKSTMVDLVTGLLKPGSGAILVDGIDLRNLEIRRWRERIGYVTQEGVLFDDTVANNIALWRDEGAEAGRRDAVRRAAEGARCADFILAHPDGYETMIGDRGVRLSGGQRQRLSIARELFKQPDVLILDEATSALDSEAELSVQRTIENLKGHATVIIIAHRLSTIRRCDQIFVLDGGRIVERGSFQELMGRPGSRFGRMCELQNTILAAPPEMAP